AAEDGVGGLARGRGQRDGDGEVDFAARDRAAGYVAGAELALQRARKLLALLPQIERDAELLLLIARSGEVDRHRPRAGRVRGAARRSGRGPQLDLAAVDEDLCDAPVAREQVAARDGEVGDLADLD